MPERPEMIQAHVNLFGYWNSKFTAADVFSRKPGTEPVSDMLDLFLGVKLEALSVGHVERFAELSPPELYLPIVPDEKQFVARLVRPLKSAKGSYCFEHFLATIALSGLAGESLAMLLFRMNEFTLNGKKVEGEQEKALFGAEFDKLGQERRLKVLKGLSYITDEQYQLFNELRGLRRPYLHLWEMDTSKEQTDAKKMFHHAMRLFLQIMGIKIISGVTHMNPRLLAYIRAKGSAPA